MPESLDFEGFTQLFLSAWTESLQSEVRIMEGPEQDGARDADGRGNGDDGKGMMKPQSTRSGLKRQQRKLPKSP